MTSTASLVRVFVVVFAAAAVGLGCAASSQPGAPGAAPPAADTDSRRQVDDTMRALERAEAELGAVRVETKPDCARACALAEDVCGLAERICALAARFSPDDSVAARCADGRARCARARANVAASCACPARPRD